LRIHLAQADAIDAAIAEIDTEVSDRLEPFRQAALRLTTIPGVSAVIPVARKGRTRGPSSTPSCRHADSIAADAVDSRSGDTLCLAGPELAALPASRRTSGVVVHRI
jgi:hypothetical protein